MAEFINTEGFEDWEDWVVGGVDWLERLHDAYSEAGEPLMAVGFRIDDKVLPVNQLTTSIFMSACNDQMDCVIYTDPEDGMSWTWYREECPFEDVIGAIGHLATTVCTPRPMDFVIEHFEAREDKKLEEELKHLDDL